MVDGRSALCAMPTSRSRVGMVSVVWQVSRDAPCLRCDHREVRFDAPLATGNGLGFVVDVWYKPAAIRWSNNWLWNVLERLFPGNRTTI